MSENGDSAENKIFTVNLDDDEEYARRLQETFDREILEISDDEVVAADEILARQLQEKFNGEVDNGEQNEDDEDVVFIPSKVDVVDVESYEGDCDWMIAELGQKFDPNFNQDWKEIHEFVPNMTKIWDHFWSKYFPPLKDSMKKPNIGWNLDLGEKSFKISLEEVNFNADLQVYPRMDQFSTMLRAMMSYYLQFHCEMPESSANFQFNLLRMRKHVNSLWLANIRPNDVMEGTSEVYRRQWYRCTGICQNYSPFHGIFRSEDQPGGKNQWWLEHREKCGASLFRIYIATRKIGGASNRLETKYLANVKHMKVKVDIKNSSFITPQEFFDLTDEDCIPRQQYSATINCDEESIGEVTNQEPAKIFYAKFDQCLGDDYDSYNVPCPLCAEKIPRKLLGNHFDGCRGFVNKSIKLAPKIASRLVSSAFNEASTSSSSYREEPSPKRLKTTITID